MVNNIQQYNLFTKLLRRYLFNIFQHTSVNSIDAELYKINSIKILLKHLILLCYVVSINQAIVWESYPLDETVSPPTGSATQDCVLVEIRGCDKVIVKTPTAMSSKDTQIYHTRWQFPFIDWVQLFTKLSFPGPPLPILVEKHG